MAKPKQRAPRIRSATLTPKALYRSASFQSPHSFAVAPEGIGRREDPMTIRLPTIGGEASLSPTRFAADVKWAAISGGQSHGTIFRETGHDPIAWMNVVFSNRVFKRPFRNVHCAVGVFVRLAPASPPSSIGRNACGATRIAPIRAAGSLQISAGRGDSAFFAGGVELALEVLSGGGDVRLGVRGSSQDSECRYRPQQGGAIAARREDRGYPSPRAGFPGAGRRSPGAHSSTSSTGAWGPGAHP